MNSKIFDSIWKMGLDFTFTDKDSEIKFKGFLEETCEVQEGNIESNLGTNIPSNRYILYAQAVENFPDKRGSVFVCEEGNFVLLDAKAFYFDGEICHRECVVFREIKGAN